MLMFEQKLIVVRFRDAVRSGGTFAFGGIDHSGMPIWVKCWPLGNASGNRRTIGLHEGPPQDGSIEMQREWALQIIRFLKQHDPSWDYDTAFIERQFPLSAAVFAVAFAAVAVCTTLWVDENNRRFAVIVGVIAAGWWCILDLFHKLEDSLLINMATVVVNFALTIGCMLLLCKLMLDEWGIANALPVWMVVFLFKVATVRRDTLERRRISADDQRNVIRWIEDIKDGKCNFARRNVDESDPDRTAP